MPKVLDPINPLDVIMLMEEQDLPLNKALNRLKISNYQLKKALLSSSDETNARYWSLINKSLKQHRDNLRKGN